jgi:hypothetical protein
MNYMPEHLTVVKEVVWKKPVTLQAVTTYQLPLTVCGAPVEPAPAVVNKEYEWFFGRNTEDTYVTLTLYKP